MPELIKSRNLGNPYAVGRTAEIYDWEPGWIIKLYFDWFKTEAIKYEQSIATAICAAGLPVPAVGELVRVNGRTGLLYQKINGQSMDMVLANLPFRIFAYARILAELHAEMHAKPILADVPQMRNKLRRKIHEAPPLPDNLRTAALKSLEDLPDGNRLCHGDFHPGNILINESGAVIIDWIDATIGSPLADVARTTILALGMAAMQPGKIADLGIRMMHSLYLRRYFQLRPEGYEEYRRWLPIVAAARLDEGIDELEPWLLEQAEL